MRFLKSLTLLILFTSVILISHSVQAQSDTASTIQLSNKLNDLKMFDWSFYLLNQEIAAKPADKNKLLVQKAQTLFSQGKIDEGEKILNSIPAGDPARNFANLILGIKFVNQGANNKAVKPLEDYFVFMEAYMGKNKPPTKTDSIETEFMKAVAYLRHAYTKLGQPQDAVKAMDHVKVLQKWLNGGASGRDANEQEDQYESILLNSQAKLDAAESMIAEGKTGWETIVNSVLKPLEGIYWSGATAWTAMACVERTRALCMLGRYADAKVELAKYLKLVKNLDAGYAEQDMLYAAPSAKAYLWRGKLYLGMAAKSKEKGNRIKLNFKAAKSFLRVIIKYDLNQCPYSGKAFSGFNMAKEALKKDGKEIELPTGIKAPSGGVATYKRKSADDMFNRKKYKEAIPLYLKLLRAPGGRTSQDTPDFLYRASLSYVNTGGILEAMALAGYLGDTFPDDKQFTPVTLLLVGEHFWKIYKKPGPLDAVKKEALENALKIYEVYLKKCPTHEYAAPISSRVAKVYYDRASAMAKAAAGMSKSNPDKLAKTNEAREAFKKAIPMYQYIVDNYAPTEMGKSAAYLLAWCYTNSRNYVKGAELFQKFADLETNWEKPKQRNMGQVAKAKYHAAENYLQEGLRLEKEGKALRKQAENAPQELAAKPAVKTEKSVKKTDKKEDDAKNTPEGAKKKVLAEKKAPQTESEFLAAAAAKDQEAKTYYLKSVANINELLDKWMKPGGRLAEVKKRKALKKIKEIKEKSVALLGWAYDSAREENKAIQSFTSYIKEFPESKGIPKAMLRLGMLYLEQDKPNEAAQVLNTLSAKYPEEGKKALPKLARAMYDIKKFDKSIDAVTKIFAAQKVDVAVADLRWIAKNMVSCGGTHPKEGALLSQKACQKLEELIKKPVLADWVGKPKAKILKNDPKKRRKTFAMLKEQLLFMSANASYWAKDYQSTVNALSTLLENENTPYFWDAYFLRGEAYIQLNKPEKALDDYGQISMALLGAPNAQPSLDFKVKCKIGDAYVYMKKYGKAVGSYSNAVMAILDNGNDADATLRVKKKPDAAELKAQKKWLEHAVFMAACCQKAEGNKKEVQELQELYRKKFVHGHFRKQINALPKPEEALKLFKE